MGAPGGRVCVAVHCVAGRILRGERVSGWGGEYDIVAASGLDEGVAPVRIRGLGAEKDVIAGPVDPNGDVGDARFTPILVAIPVDIQPDIVADERSVGGEAGKAFNVVVI